MKFKPKRYCVWNIVYNELCATFENLKLGLSARQQAEKYRKSWPYPYYFVVLREGRKPPPRAK